MLNDAKQICLKAIDSCLPYDSVMKAIGQSDIDKDVYLVAVGKAAFSMAQAASDSLNVIKGIVISKYGHIKGELENIDTYEAGHPVLDQNGIEATKKVIGMCSDLSENDTVLFLLSGGASSLFEDPVISLEKLQDLNEQMLKKGLNIEQMNTIRKKLSRVKGGRFADICAPAKVYSIILSDVLGDKIDVIGSGPTVKDSSTVKQALELMERYDLDVDEDTIDKLKESPEGKAENVINQIVGSVSLLCRQACEEAEKLGYRSLMINDHFDLDYEDAKNYIYDLIERYRHTDEKLALILGGEIVVNVRGQGLGGRCQQLAFSQVRHLSGIDNVLFICAGSDGTDGPTDAAGAYVDGKTCGKLLEKGIDPEKILEDNDTYHAFEKIGSLIMTGPTGTNVNDLMLVLIRAE